VDVACSERGDGRHSCGVGRPAQPGSRDFEFGAGFSLDTKSTGDHADNGDNLIQRGLFGDKAQYKIQVDKGKVSCRIKGSGGAQVSIGGKVSATGAVITGDSDQFNGLIADAYVTIAQPAG
jgi:hypothetical protein